MEVIKSRNHLSFKPMVQLRKLIYEKVTDINTARKNKTTDKEKNWIFPDFPEDNSENYPRVSLVNGRISFSDYGTGNFINYERNITSNDVEHIVYGRVATFPLTIVVFVKRNQYHEVEYYDGILGKIKNTKQADYLGEKIEKSIEMFRKEYFITEDMDIEVKEITRSYDDNDFLIAKNIEVEIVIRDEWETDLTDPASTIGNVKDINLNTEVTF